MTAGELALRTAARLRSAGWQAYLVGGCVRDILLQRDPEDYDVATDARPDDIIRLFPGTQMVGAQFGVALVRQEGAQVEIATFRSEGVYSDGRRPDHVAFETDPRKDALRRDFTINALFLEPDRNEILDFVGGRSDLDRRLIRAIGDPAARFREDHLRMLRAVRFAARLGFEIDGATMNAIRRFAANIRDVSAERQRYELNRILIEGGARRGFELLDASGLLLEVLPEIAAMKGVEQPPEYHPEGDVWVHTLMMLDGLQKPPVTLAWGVLLHDVGKPPTFRVEERIRFDGHVEEGVHIARRILNRLRFSNDDIHRIETLVANHMRFKDVTQMRESTLKRFLRLERFEEHLELHRLDCESSHGHLDNYEFVRKKLAETPPAVLKPPRLVTGDDLIAAGYQPGPAFGGMLRSVEDAQLEGTVLTRDEGLDLIRRLYGPPS